MKRENSNRTRIVGLRFTPLEYAELEKRFRASTCRKLSDHIRSHLFNKPLVATYRNQSLDELMEETAVLTSELRAIGNNINQIARKINTLNTVPDFKGHLYLFEIQRDRLFDKFAKGGSRFARFRSVIYYIFKRYSWQLVVKSTLFINNSFSAFLSFLSSFSLLRAADLSGISSK